MFAEEKNQIGSQKPTYHNSPVHRYCVHHGYKYNARNACATRAAHVRIHTCASAHTCIDAHMYAMRSAHMYTHPGFETLSKRDCGLMLRNPFFRGSIHRLVNV